MPTTLKSKTTLYIALGVLVVVVLAVGGFMYWHSTHNSKTVTGSNNGQKVLMTTAPVMAMPGLVTAQLGNNFMLAPYNAASFDPTLTKRTVVTDKNTIFEERGAKKDAKTYAAETAAYLAKVKSANAGDVTAKQYIAANPYPSQYSYKTVSPSALEVGDSVNVLTTTDVRQVQEFTASEVLIEATTTTKLKPGESVGVSVSIGAPTITQKVASLFSAFPFINHAYASAPNTMNQGKLHWTGVWTANQYSCDTGYSLMKFKANFDNSSNNAMWYACFGPNTPTVTLTASPSNLTPSTPTTVLNWTSMNASSCTGTNFNTGNATSGSASTSPSSSTTYTVTCTGSGTAQASVTVTVQAPPDLNATLLSGQTNINAVINTPVSLSATVANIGSGPSGAPFQTTFWTNTTKSQTGANAKYTEFTSGTPSGFPANYSETDGPQLPVTSTFTSTGTYYYQVCANMDQNGNFTVPSSYNSSANNCSAWGTITVTPPPPTVSCAANGPTTIAAGGSVPWSATVSGGTPPYTYAWGGSVSGTTQSVTQSYPTAGTYTGQVTVTDSAGAQTTAQCSPGNTGNPITVVACTPALNPANPSTVTLGQTSSLTYTEPTFCAASCQLSDGSNVKSNTGSATTDTVSPTTSPTSSYSVICGSYSSAPDTINVNVPSVSLSAVPTRVSSGATNVLLSWTNTLLDPVNNSCTITRNGSTLVGSQYTSTTGTNVSEPTPVNSQLIYKITCTTGTAASPGAPVTSQAIVNIAPTFTNF